MFEFTRFTSPKTATAWSGAGIGKPFGLTLSTFVHSIVTLVVSIIINITDANEPGNDYGEGTGWVVMIPGPAIVFLWSIIFMFVCKYSYFSPALALGTYLIFAIGVIAEGIVTALLYEWHDIAWLPAIFIITLGLNCAVFFVYSCIAIHRKSHAKDIALDTA
ncbi:hypothetical protein TWF173_000639 [Orbilia oligospora]|uniref:Uncharacterized protein n=2 Tax=Orbilia oligospora TaxID=2813651 RepID=G1XM62_ARTOA|nr:hypothetical protein AOL_s00140g31 [Orbilia oligospora ATCC 24927]EGX45715.1 hypothetical protein AOL_s00140g31 [Orbilia oligospora ATCC 24927]KAF3272420.1 hypothetical protein TWF970_010046 [Orbilia oligospora]KAF3308904.1 hypothetical protein TWF173_000639 [Orbilia oligospora]